MKRDASCRSLSNHHQPTPQRNTMNKRQAQRYANICQSLALLGFSQDETDRLLRIEKTLHRWHEMECNGEVEREGEEETGKPHRVWYRQSTGQRYSHPMPDREKGALRRLSEILKGKSVTHYQQGDPRGCALYLLRPTDVPAGESVHGYYSRGIALCID